jgi:hypothetical protein
MVLRNARVCAKAASQAVLVFQDKAPINPLVYQHLQVGLPYCNNVSASDFAFGPHAQQQQVKCKKHVVKRL